MELMAEDAGVLYKFLLRELVRAKEVKVKGEQTKEILGVHLILNSPLKNIILSPTRHVNLRFMVAEWLWMMKGRNDVEYLARYNPNMRKYSDDGHTLNGAYGPKIVDQLPYVVETLALDLFSRQAVLTIWEWNPRPSKDIPCTVSMQFVVRDCKMHMFITMRSSDAWLGIPYDIFSFTMIQNYLAYLLQVDLGQFHMFLGSSHLYMSNYHTAVDVSEEFSSHGKSHQIETSPLINKDSPFMYWEDMLVTPEETRKKISEYDIPGPEQV